MNFHDILQTTSLSMQIAGVGLMSMVLLSMMTVALHPGTARRRYPPPPAGRRGRKAASRAVDRESGLLILLARMARVLHAWAGPWFEKSPGTEESGREHAEERRNDPDREEEPQVPVTLLHADPDGVSRRELKQLYRDLMKTWHPDLCQDPQRRPMHAENSIRINELYEARDLAGLRQLRRKLEGKEVASGARRARA